MTERDAAQIWRESREAKVRALYFGDMLSRYAKWQQVVVGLTLVLSSAAVIAVVSKTLPSVPLAFAATVAAVNALSIATNLNQKVVTLATLQSSWDSLRLEYSELWSKWYDKDAESSFEALQRRANDLGVLATYGAPWDRKAVARWEEFVDSEVEQEEG